MEEISPVGFGPRIQSLTNVQRGQQHVLPVVHTILMIAWCLVEDRSSYVCRTGGTLKDPNSGSTVKRLALFQTFDACWAYHFFWCIDTIILTNLLSSTNRGLEPLSRSCIVHKSPSCVTGHHLTLNARIFW